MIKIWKCEYCRYYNPDVPVSSNVKIVSAMTECRFCGAPREIDVKLIDPKYDVLISTYEDEGVSL